MGGGKENEPSLPPILHQRRRKTHLFLYSALALWRCCFLPLLSATNMHTYCIGARTFTFRVPHCYYGRPACASSSPSHVSASAWRRKKKTARWRECLFFSSPSLPASEDMEHFAPSLSHGRQTEHRKRRRTRRPGEGERERERTTERERGRKRGSEQPKEKWRMEKGRKKKRERRSPRKEGASLPPSSSAVRPSLSPHCCYIRRVGRGLPRPQPKNEKQ